MTKPIVTPNKQAASARCWDDGVRSVCRENMWPRCVLCLDHFVTFTLLTAVCKCHKCFENWEKCLYAVALLTSTPLDRSRSACGRALPSTFDPLVPFNTHSALHSAAAAAAALQNAAATSWRLKQGKRQRHFSNCCFTVERVLFNCLT